MTLDRNRDPGPGPARRDRTVPRLSVLLLDDHRAFTDALRVSLDLQPDLQCVAVAHSAREGLARIGKGGFDVAIVDLALPDGGGIDVIGELARRCPDVRVIVLTAHCRPDLARRAVDAGADAFLGKDATLERIVAAVRTADGRHPVVDAGPGPDGVDLTDREHDVLRQLGCGHDASRISEELGISLYTTRGHIKSAMAKLGVHSQLGAVVAAEQRGLITLGSRY